jgi:hypothetical protein
LGRDTNYCIQDRAYLFLHLCDLTKRCLSLVLLRAIRREERRCNRSFSVVYAELGIDLLNVPMLANLELLVSSVLENADVEEGDCFA